MQWDSRQYELSGDGHFQQTEVSTCMHQTKYDDAGLELADFKAQSVQVAL